MYLVQYQKSLTIWFMGKNQALEGTGSFNRNYSSKVLLGILLPDFISKTYVPVYCTLSDDVLNLNGIMKNVRSFFPIIQEIRFCDGQIG